MYHYEVDRVPVSSTFEASEEEIRKYIAAVMHKEKGKLQELRLDLIGDNTVKIDYRTFQKFERIRRITGYLTGDVSCWNDAKQEEERERTKNALI